jgi:hypothetical protein
MPNDSQPDGANLRALLDTPIAEAVARLVPRGIVDFAELVDLAREIEP